MLTPDGTHIFLHINIYVIITIKKKEDLNLRESELEGLEEGKKSEGNFNFNSSFIIIALNIFKGQEMLLTNKAIL